MQDCCFEMFFGPRLPTFDQHLLMVYSSSIGYAGWCVVFSFGHIQPMYTGGYLQWFSESWDAVAGCGELLVECTLLCCHGCGGCGMVLFFVILLLSFLLGMLDLLLLCFVEDCFTRLAESCQASALFWSVDAAIIELSRSGCSSGGCSQNAGAQKVSSMFCVIFLFLAMEA